ncbi:C-type lectin domain family 10 member A [Astyanax mexicanus]|uniref:C-type lectin domain family 10 member A-like n=1 Tax=Astyanax mexicanus TaxID=7994 RepID=A0A8B9RNA3_ASTMX|nr:C-type lectin domain family 10 member A [Astyanax mexicanus]XP_022533332.1 C-type lectin domain family 10 member A [Astyanax mexicanus]KAG9269443.1 C-type lectin domain family 10 member A-like isoform X1 [Astyanax mexicanus]
MRDATEASSSNSNEYHDEFDNTDTKAIWNKNTVSRFTAVPPAGQFRWYLCLFGVSVFISLSLIIAISVTKVNLDGKLSAVEKEISNLTQTLMSITARMNRLDQHGENLQQNVRQLGANLDTLHEQSEDMSFNVERIEEFASQLKCLFNKLNNVTQDQCCPLQWSLFSNHCYYFSDYGMSWHKARDQCENMKAELLILKSREEKDFVIQHTMPHYYWLGLSDERTGEWEWLDGTPYVIDRREWIPGQPDDWRLHGLGGGEDCAHFHRDGRYNDDHCSRGYRFVCKAHTKTVH